MKNLLLVNSGFPSKRYVIDSLLSLPINITILSAKKDWPDNSLEWIEADLENQETCLSLINSHIANTGSFFDGVVTFDDASVLLTEKISQELNLIGFDPNLVKTIKDKRSLRSFLLKNGFNSPKYHEIHEESDLQTILNEFTFPVVVKPSYGQGSRFVEKISSAEELLATYNKIIKQMEESTLVKTFLNKNLLIEVYIGGDEVDIDVLVQDGKICLLSISDNWPTKQPYFIEFGGNVPSLLPKKAQEDLAKMVADFFTLTNIQNGCFHVEGKYSSGKAYMIECNMRMGGAWVQDFAKAAKGVDLVQETVRVALGERVSIPSDWMQKGVAIAVHIDIQKSGKLKEVIMSDELAKKDYFISATISKSVGSELAGPPLGFDNLGWIVVIGATFEEAKVNAKEALNFIRYEVM